MANRWTWMDAGILDSQEWFYLSDREWRARFTAILENKQRWHYSPAPARLKWMGIRKEMTKIVFQRDEPNCRYCRSTENLEIDHIIPLARGGSNDLDNLQILCRTCNRKKWAHIP